MYVCVFQMQFDKETPYYNMDSLIRPVSFYEKMRRYGVQSQYPRSEPPNYPNQRIADKGIVAVWEKRKDKFTLFPPHNTVAVHMVVTVTPLWVCGKPKCSEKAVPSFLALSFGQIPSNHHQGNAVKWSC